LRSVWNLRVGLSVKTKDGFVRSVGVLCEDLD
jgi:hypothetical protein